MLGLESVVVEDEINWSVQAEPPVVEDCFVRDDGGSANINIFCQGT